MQIIKIVAFAITAFGLSSALTGWICRHALSNSLLDVPNDRSSHKIPTPRGGGLAIVVVFLLGLPLLSINAAIADNLFWALLGSGALVAAVGFIDDRQSVAASYRLLVHFAAAAWALVCLGGIPAIVIFGWPIGSAWVLFPLAMVYLVWLLNLYNFMDGIDGLAGIEAISVCLGGIIVAFITDNGQFWGLVLLATVTAGFLVWNFPPAKIFMGDVGSGFMGMVLAIFSLQAASFSAASFSAWLILLGVFIVDASWTLARRFLQGEKVYQAHRSHAYQHAASHYQSHRQVTLAVAAINLCWLLPLALLVAMQYLDGLVGLLIAYCPLLLLVMKFKAGIKCEF